MIASIAAANYIIHKSKESKQGVYIDALHKILRAANEQCLEETGQPLFSEQFVETSDGPRLLNVSMLFSLPEYHRRMPIPRPATEVYRYRAMATANKEAKRFLDEAWNAHLTQQQD